MGEDKIQTVKLADLHSIFANKAPRGRFMAKTKCVWFALDNRTWNPVEMGFPTEELATAWLDAVEPQ